MAIDRKAEMDLQRETLKKLLKSLADFRQATLSPTAEDLYVKQLRGYDMRDVTQAIRDLALEPRKDFQPAFPDLGTIIGRVEAIRDNRTRVGRFVSCGDCAAGFLILNEDGSKHRRVEDSGRDTYAKECQCLTRWRAGEQVRCPDPVAEHLRDIQLHPERYVPVDACIQVGKDLSASKLKRGTPEYKALQKKLTREMNEKWLEQVSADKVRA